MPERKIPALLAAQLSPEHVRRVQRLQSIEWQQGFERAEIIVCAWPLANELTRVLPRLRWLHYLAAGAWDLRECAVWGTDVIVTTSRGHTNSAGVARYVLDGFRRFAESVERATVCVIGLGGVGSAVAARCAEEGMRVVGVRRDAGRGVAGVERVFPPDRLREALEGARFVAICCQLTGASRHLIDDAALMAMDADAVLVNAARAGIVDHDALLRALDAGHLRGAMLDVVDSGHAVARHPRVVATPHVAGAGANITRLLDLFEENLQAWLAGEPLRNRIDWERGY